MRREVVKMPLDVLRESNRRMADNQVNTPLDFLRILNREILVRERRERLLKRVSDK